MVRQIVTIVTFACFVIPVLSGATRGAEEPKVPAKAPPKVGKLDVNRAVTLDDMVGARGFELPAQSGPQTITVTFSSSKCDVSVYVFPGAIGDSLLTEDSKKALAGKTGKVGAVSAEVPANTAVTVVIRSATEKTTVDVKITNEIPDPKDAQIKKLEEENAALKKELADVKKQLADLKKQLGKK